MFETTVVAGGGRASSRRVALLTFSVAAHTFVGAAVLLAGLHSLQFPTNAPKEMATYELAPPPPPMPVAQGVRNPAPAQKDPTPAAAAKIPTAPPADVTPSTVPSTTTIASAATATGDPAIGNSGPGDGTGTEIGPKGDPNGVKGGIPIDAPPLPAAPPDRIYRASEVNPPVVIRRVSPEYPRVAQNMRKSGWVIVECIIDKTGHTRDAHVVGSNFTPFEAPALEAVQQWQFRPGTLGGQAVDTLFELRVTFTLQ